MADSGRASKLEFLCVFVWHVPVGVSRSTTLADVITHWCWAPLPGLTRSHWVGGFLGLLLSAYCLLVLRFVRVIHMCLFLCALRGLLSLCKLFVRWGWVPRLTRVWAGLGVGVRSSYPFCLTFLSWGVQSNGVNEGFDCITQMLSGYRAFEEAVVGTLLQTLMGFSTTISRKAFCLRWLSEMFYDWYLDWYQGINIWFMVFWGRDGVRFLAWCGKPPIWWWLRFKERPLSHIRVTGLQRDPKL
jgi:hypothetical protein